MLRKIIIILALFISSSSNAQLLKSFIHNAEFGIGAGVGQYFGDINTDGGFKSLNLSMGGFIRKQISNYVSVRGYGEYSFLGYSDIYSTNSFQRSRNLSFNTNVFEAGLSLDLNFYRFQPGFEGFNFTPYVGLGISAFYFNPYTYLDGNKIYLQPIGTEGQGSVYYPNSQPYSKTALSVPLTIGLKFAINQHTNIYAEAMYRFTSTDYLDDVSSYYATDAFPDQTTIGYRLQDRSNELGTPIGVKGRLRGDPTKKDGFVTFKLGVSFNIQTYVCPKY